jgi:deferrochelatase/peroxidase EfeB
VSGVSRRSLLAEKRFLAVQARLDGEPLEEYVLPVGGGFFLALPGTSHPDRFLGADLLAP